MLSQIPAQRPRRGELDAALEPHSRRVLSEMYLELRDLHRRATLIDDGFLAELIATAADEARDQLRDDKMLRESGNLFPDEDS